MIILFSYTIVILLGIATWAVYKSRNNPGVIDLTWVLGIYLVSLTYLLYHHHSTKTFILTILVSLWAGRLGYYLWSSRIKLNKIDKRYLLLSEKAQDKDLFFFWHYQLQGLLLFIVALPFYFSAQTSWFSSWDIIGFLLCVIGIMGEAHADKQLHQFQQEHPGKICDVGLWARSRHPNYFFEWLIWLGFALMGLEANWGFLGLISPIVLFYIMHEITGPLTERCSSKKDTPEWAAYTKKTPFFFPW